MTVDRQRVRDATFCLHPESVPSWDAEYPRSWMSSDSEAVDSGVFCIVGACDRQHVAFLADLDGRQLGDHRVPRGSCREGRA